MPLVVDEDPEKALADYLYALVPDLSQASEYSVGTEVAPGVTPTRAVRVHLTGGSTEGPTHSRPILDVRIWADGTVKTKPAAKQLARILHGHIRRDFRCRTFTYPVALPDPVDPSKVHVLFSVELLRAGVQS